MNDQTVATVKPRQLSDFIGLSFTFFTSLMAITYATGFIEKIMNFNYLEICLFIIIVILGYLACAMRANIKTIVIAGITMSFFILSFHQSSLNKYLIFSAVLFSIGIYGLTVSRNAVRVLMSIELMLNAVNINLVAFAQYIDPIELKGQVFAIFVLTVAAAEAAVGLAIVLSIYRFMASVDMERFKLLRW